MSILEIYQDHGLTAKQKTAAEWCGPCPACGGNDRFVLLLDQGKDGRGRYFCRQCGLSGDCIQFLREFRGLGYREACRELGREPAPRSGETGTGHARQERKASGWTPKDSPLPCDKWQAKARALVKWAAQELASDPEALSWLETERGITAETAGKYRLGWNGQDKYRDRRAWGLPEERKADGKAKRLWIPAGLVLPVLDVSGRIRRIKFRRHKPGPKESKYIYLPAEPKNAAPLVLDQGAKAWAVVESELDAFLLAQEAGDLVNVMALGSASMKPDTEAYEMLTRSEFILVSLDFDEAGNKAAWAWWPEHFENCRIWPVPEGKDPTDAWRAGWDLRAWIEGGLPPALLPKPAAPQDGPQDAGQESQAETVTFSSGGHVAQDHAQPGPVQDDPARLEFPKAAEAFDMLQAGLPRYGGRLIRYPDSVVGFHFPDGTRDLALLDDVAFWLEEARPYVERIKDRLPLREGWPEQGENV